VIRVLKHTVVFILQIDVALAVFTAVAPRAASTSCPSRRCLLLRRRDTPGRAPPPHPHQPDVVAPPPCHPRAVRRRRAAVLPSSFSGAASSPSLPPWLPPRPRQSAPAAASLPSSERPRPSPPRPENARAAVVEGEHVHRGKNGYWWCVVWIVDLLYQWDDMLYEWDDFSEFCLNENYESVPKRMIKIILVNFI